MITHVFIVDSKTFKIHLEYLFAGTGAQDLKVDFNNGSATNLHSSRENLLASMTADACRVRKGDLIIFYLQQNFQEKIFEGKFFGIFEAVEDFSFIDHNDSDQYLKEDLGKSLTFRTLIKPNTVYIEGVTEWEALDEIKDIQSPNQMLWSLIYRKLKGNRGNTMITIYESEKLCQLLRNKNNRQGINTAQKLSFDPVNQRIIKTNDQQNEYVGRKEEIQILPRLTEKYIQRKSFEPHLQSYLIKNIGKNEAIDKLLYEGEIEWRGNEVACGVGMQRIDIMLSTVQNSQRTVIPIELKAVEADKNIIKQIQRYLDWLRQYYLPNRHSDVHPTIISRKIENKNRSVYTELLDTFRSFNDKNKTDCKPINYIEFYITKGGINFSKIDY